MRLRRELLLTIGALVVLNLTLAFGAIGLLARMAPAIDHILQENVYSIVAAEEVLAALAEAGGDPLSAPAREQVRQALENAKLNVTESEEHQVLASLTAELEGAMSGVADARRRLVGDLRRLILINREAMGKAGEEAGRLGSAGAWAAVLIGFVSFLLSLLVLTRLEKRFVRPLMDLYQVLESARQGNRLRRCQLSDAPREVVQVTNLVNKLLDERLQRLQGDTR